MKFIDICSGIGGFRSALEKHGHECVVFAEIDKFAKQSYKAIYDTENEEELDDITSVTDEHFRLYRGQVDIITGGFPCQTFSIAGNRRGFEDTRGTIFFHIARAIKEIQPSYVLLENVKGLLSHDKGRTYGTIVQALDELGYFIEWGLFNSKYWGVPQNRERVYILVTRKDVWKEPKLFNLLKQQTSVDTRLVDILETNVDESYYLSEEKTRKLTLNEDLSGRLNHYDYRDVDSVHSVNKVSPTLNTMQGGDRQPKVAVVGNTSNTHHNAHNVHDVNGLSPTIAARDYKGAKQIAIREATKKGYVEAMEGDSVNTSFPNSKTRRGRVGKQVAQTLQAGDVNQGVVTKDIRTTEDGFHTYRNDDKKSSIQGTHVTYKEGKTHALTSNHVPMTLNNLRIRKLTPLECWRLQGFTDDQFYKAKNSGVSNSQLYKQAGNAVTVNVVDAIVGELE
ncbi:DNA (cytosine-5-)-methyltransferase [Staphylococcus hominis]|uniref:DNA (cytosine-5-)-methyltransferase n=1 Tax=Staphylococcus hominis TaxID=1290 RepID=UPI0034D762A5